MSIKSLCNESKTKSNNKDLWNTSNEAIFDAEYLTGLRFNVDACAIDSLTAICDLFISPDQDALVTEWDLLKSRSVVWCNPPFSKKVDFLIRGAEQSVKHGIPVVFMLPAEFCSQWFRRYVSTVASTIFVPDGRYNYLDPDTKIAQSGVNFASCFVLFDGSQGYATRKQPQYVEFKKGVGNL